MTRKIISERVEHGQYLIKRFDCLPSYFFLTGEIGSCAWSLIFPILRYNNFLLNMC